LDFWADSFGGQGDLEFFGGAGEGCAGVFVAQAGGEAVAGAVACGAEEGYCAGCGHCNCCCCCLGLEVKLRCRVVEAYWYVSEVEGCVYVLASLRCECCYQILRRC
jgi:hypothetical protein